MSLTELFKSVYPGEYEFKANFSVPQTPKDVHVNIESNDKVKVMDWMQEIMSEYGIDSKQGEEITESVWVWNQGTASLTCNFKID